MAFPFVLLLPDEIGQNAHLLNPEASRLGLMINKCSGGEGGNVHSRLSGLQSRIPESSSLAEGTKGSTDGLFGRLKAGQRASRTKSKSHSHKFPLLPRPRFRMKMEMKLVEGNTDVIVLLGLIKAKRKSFFRSQARPETLLTLIPWNTLPVDKTSRTFCQPSSLSLNFCRALHNAGRHSYGGWILM